MGAGVSHVPSITHPDPGHPGNEATIDYTFVDMTVEVPKTTGPDSERATWKLNGTLRITTKDKNNRGAVNGSGA